jgi:hypothetical protein
MHDRVSTLAVIDEEHDMSNELTKVRVKATRVLVYRMAEPVEYQLEGTKCLFRLVECGWYAEMEMWGAYVEASYHDFSMDRMVDISGRQYASSPEMLAYKLRVEYGVEVDLVQ